MALGARAVGGAAPAQVADRLVQRVRLQTCRRQRFAGRRGRRQHEREQQPLDGDEAIARLGGNLFGGVEHTHTVIVEAGLRLRAGAGDGGDLRQNRIGFGHGARRIAARGLDQPRCHALIILQQRLQNMFGGNPLMVHPDRNGKRGLQEAARAIGEFVDVHGRSF